MTTRRVAAAIELRAAALRVVEADGEALTISGLEVRAARRPPIQIVYAPKMYDLSETLVAQAERYGARLRPETPHVLDIWITGQNRCSALDGMVPA
jgi:hypothetical protein